MGRLNDKRTSRKDRKLKSALYKADVANFGEEKANELKANSEANKREEEAPIVQLNPVYAEPTINDKPVGQAVAEAVIKKGETLEEIGQAKALGQEAQKEVDSATKPYNEILKVVENAPLDNPPQLTKDDISVGDFYGEDELTEEQLKEMSIYHQSYLAQQKANEVEPAIERLSIEEYFPDLKDSINVGTFSGRYIGSRSIFAGGGAVVPYSILDARNRAIENDAKAKAATANKWFDMIDTVPQYQEVLHDHVFDFYDKYYELSGGDVASLYSGKTPLSLEFLRGQQGLKDKAGEITELDQMADDILKRKDDAKNPITVPDEVLKAIHDIRSAEFSMEDFLSGKTTLNKQREILKEFNNLHFRVKEIGESIQDHPNIISLRPEVNTEEAAKTAMEAFVRKAGQSYDSWYSGVKKYFDLSRVEPLIDELFKSNDFYDESETGKAKALEALFGYLPKEVTFKREGEATDNYEMARLNFEKELERKKSFLGVVNDRMNGLDGGPSVHEQIAAILKDPNIKRNEKRNRVKEVMATIGAGQVHDAPHGGSYVSIPMPSVKYKQKDITQDDYVYVQKHTGTDEYVAVKLTDYFADNGKTYKLPKDKDAKEWYDKMRAGAPLYAGLKEGRVSSGYISTTDGRVHRYSERNEDAYLYKSAGYTTILTEKRTPAFTKTVEVDGKKVEKEVPIEGIEIFTTNSLHSPERQAVLDVNYHVAQPYVKGQGKYQEGQGAETYD